MSRIFLIGNSILSKEHDAVLSSKNRTLLKFKSIHDLRYRPENRPDIIILDQDQGAGASFKAFLRESAGIPKIVFSADHTFRGFSRWLKYPHAYPVYAPSPRDLDFLIDKALKDKKMQDENERFRRRLAGLTEELNFFVEVSKTLTSTLELGEILTTIMKKARKLIRAGSWSLLLLDEGTGELVSERFAGGNEGRKRLRKLRVKMGEGIAGWVAQQGIPVVIPDVSIDKRFRSKAGREATFKARSLMCVPIKSKGTVLGVLEIANRTADEPFTKDDLDLVMRLVDHAAIAIERASLYQKMAELSVTDDLTKLFNTRYLNRTLEIEITRSKRHGFSLALIFMDIDHFKAINDNYGHLVGSKLLVEIGQLLIKNLRTIDIVARYGGDEFVVVLPQTSPQSAAQIAERTRRAIEQNVFLKKEGYALRLTASFGVASYPESAKSKEDLLRLADEAMYRVKFTNRNGVYAIV